MPWAFLPVKTMEDGVKAASTDTALEQIPALCWADAHYLASRDGHGRDADYVEGLARALHEAVKKATIIGPQN